MFRPPQRKQASLSGNYSELPEHLSGIRQKRPVHKQSGYFFAGGIKIARNGEFALSRADTFGSCGFRNEGNFDSGSAVSGNDNDILFFRFQKLQETGLSLGDSDRNHCFRSFDSVMEKRSLKNDEKT
jgi:hypothetical protein